MEHDGEIPAFLRRLAANDQTDPPKPAHHTSMPSDPKPNRFWKDRPKKCRFCGETMPESQYGPHVRQHPGWDKPVRKVKKK